MKKVLDFAIKGLTNVQKLDIIVGQIANHGLLFMEKYSSGEEAPLLRV